MQTMLRLAADTFDDCKTGISHCCKTVMGSNKSTNYEHLHTAVRIEHVTAHCSSECVVCGFAAMMLREFKQSSDAKHLQTTISLSSKSS
jgi:hypothetical protein